MTHSNWLTSIHHDGSSKYVSALTPLLGDTVQLRLRIAADAPVRRVYLRTFPDGEQAITPMTAAEKDTVVQWWEVDLAVRQPVEHYRFLVEAADGLWHYTAAGPTAAIPLDATDFRILADYHHPDWLDTAVFYQIFPDRFANGSPENDPQPGDYEYNGQRPQTYAWGQPPDPDQPFPLVFYGGDLPGIQQHLDYLAALGINTLYLNPIFTALSNHKYDVTDYEAVDPHFGGNEGLAALAAALQTKGMGYLLDIVPNHCGLAHPWFQTAQKEAQADTAEFFTFNEHPDQYATWLGVRSLPKLNYNSRELRRRIYEGENAVFRRWLRPPYQAAGWRVDVANMLGRQGATQIGTEVAQGIRRAVKETNPDAYLMGENFFDASSTLQGDEWDGVMNYAGFLMPLLFWLKGQKHWAHGLKEGIESPRPWPTEAFAATLTSRLAAIPWVIARQQYNLLGSHDVSRIRSTLDENDALHRLALVFLFTFPGLPGLYYGDEIGMVDDPDLGSRGCMVWDESGWDHDLLAFHKKLIKLRRASAALQTGGFEILAVEEDLLAFQREGEHGRILIIAHRHPTPRPAAPLPVRRGGIPDGTRFIEFFSGEELIVKEGALSLTAHPQGASIWIEAQT